MKCLLWLRPEGSQQVYAVGVLPNQGDAMMLDIDPALRPLLPGRLLVTVERMGSEMPVRPSVLPAYESLWMPLKPT